MAKPSSPLYKDAYAVCLKVYSESTCLNPWVLSAKFLKQARNPNIHNLRRTQMEGPDLPSPVAPPLATLLKQWRPILIHKKSLCNQLGNFYSHKSQSGVGKGDWETVMPKQERR